jgi:hypothetical protein
MAGLDTCGKSCPPPVFDPWTGHPVTSCYIDWATRPTGYNIECKKMHSRNTIKFLRTNVWKLVFLSLIERLHSTIPSLCTILQLTIRLHVLNWEVLSSYPLSSHNSQWLVKMSTWISAHVDTDCHKTWQVPEWLQTVWKASTMRWWSASSVSIAAEYKGVLSGTADKKIKRKSLGEHEGCTRITVYRYIPI